MTGAVILAAGAATRMGRLKQVLPYRGTTLLAHTLRQATGAGFEPITVVLGAQADVVRGFLPVDSVDFVENTNWERGMGSSLSTGVRRLRQRNAMLASAAILLADQPLVESRHLQEMARLLDKGDTSAIAAEYNGTLGVPAIFKEQLFNELEALPPEAGARHLLRESAFSLLRFPLPEAGVDMDTPEDFAALTCSERAAEFPDPEFHK